MFEAALHESGFLFHDEFFEPLGQPCVTIDVVVPRVLRRTDLRHDAPLLELPKLEKLFVGGNRVVPPE